MRRLLLRLLTREVEVVHFSDGDLFVVGIHDIPGKPENIVLTVSPMRMWRWQWRWKRLLDIYKP